MSLTSQKISLCFFLLLIFKVSYFCMTQFSLQLSFLKTILTGSEKMAKLQNSENEKNEKKKKKENKKK